MTSIRESLHSLSARLPELEWKLGAIPIIPSQLPRGLFRERLELTPQSCIEEIRADLDALKQQDNEKSVHFLATRVSQKINVLVRLCQQNDRKKRPVRQQSSMGVQALSTRQQWLNTLHDEINALGTQQKALTEALVHLQNTENTQAVLRMQEELGEVARRLTLAQENLERVTV